MHADTIKRRTYAYDQVLNKSIKYFNGDELAATTWINKYCLRDADGKFLELSPEDMHWRMAHEFYGKETIHPAKITDQHSDYGRNRLALDEGSIYNLFKDFKYIIPQGSVMAILGNKTNIGSLSNCVVINPPIDSYGGIFYTDQQLAQLCKRRCGVGFDISSLRPNGTKVANAAGTSSGAVSFMERFSNTTREVSQNGRRGALMLTMDIKHPDVEAFATIKNDLSKVTGANISIRISDEFMQAVDKNKTFVQQWPIDAQEPVFKQEVNARKLWEKIIESAHHSAEPGIIFWDRQHLYSTSSIYPGFRNDSTNPCSEIAMQGGDSCRLVAINLFSFVGAPFTSDATFNFRKFYEVTYEAQRLMDDLVDLELEAVARIIDKIDNDKEPDFIKQTERDIWEQLRDNGSKGRRTGLGFTALADTLAALNMKYDSDQSINMIEEIMKKKCEAEFDSSIDMAIERGPFSGFDPVIENQSLFIRNLENELPGVYQRMMQHGRRNISISTVAPTGSVSLLAQCSSGLEPVFMLSYTRKRKVSEKKSSNGKKYITDDLGDTWEQFEVYHPKFKLWKERNPAKTLEDNPYNGATAPEIDWQKRVEVQSVIQKFVTHSISSTINLPEDVSERRVGDIYMEAWKNGLKGITVYREGSRQGVLVKTDDKKKTKAEQIIENQAPQRPKDLDTFIIRFMNNDEMWLAFVGMLNERPYEIFTGRAMDSFALPNYVSKGWTIKSQDRDGKTRYDFRFVDSQGYNVTIEGLSRSFNKEYWNYAKLISGILRHGMPLTDVVHLVSNLNLDKDYINTWKNGVVRALKTFIKDGEKPKNNTCPSCRDKNGLVFEEGCLKCKNCGYTTCD